MLASGPSPTKCITHGTYSAELIRYVPAARYSVGFVRPWGLATDHAIAACIAHVESCCPDGSAAFGHPEPKSGCRTSTRGNLLTPFGALSVPLSVPPVSGNSEEASTSA